MFVSRVISAQQIDKSFENILNVLFYAAVITATLSAIGLDPLALFLSISGVVLAFAFSKLPSAMSADKHFRISLAFTQ